MLAAMGRISHMSQWTARFLVLALIAPALGPMALASSTEPRTLHCLRQPVSARPAMPCHHGMAESKPTQLESSPIESPGASFQANNSCCQNHDCCRIGTSEWAWLAFVLPSFNHPQIEQAGTFRNAALHSFDVFAQDSARAPPRS
jgi:hypothetical protein